MKSCSLEIILFSEKKRKHKAIAEWVAKTALPVIVKQEYHTKKLVLKSVTDTPPIYMS